MSWDLFTSIIGQVPNIARVVMHTKEHLAALMPDGPTLAATLDEPLSAPSREEFEVSPRTAVPLG